MKILSDQELIEKYLEDKFYDNDVKRILEQRDRERVCANCKLKTLSAEEKIWSCPSKWIIDDLHNESCRKFEN